MDGLGGAASIIAVVQITGQIVSLCGNYLLEVKNAKQDIEALHAKVATMHNVAEKLQDLIQKSKTEQLPVSKSVAHSIAQCQKDLTDLEKKLAPDRKRRVMNPFGLRAFTWPFSSKVTLKTVEKLDGYLKIFNNALQIDHVAATLRVSQKLDDTQQSQLIAQIPFVDGANFNSYEHEHEPKCLPDTRIEVLESIINWASDSSDQHIFWLSGMAGTGKSTIARTIALKLYNRRLAASFFFSKGHGDLGHARKLFSTLAVQMANTYPKIRAYLCAVVAEQPGLTRPVSLFEQYDKLILQPLRMLRDSNDTLPPPPLVIVLDALDECESQEDIGSILRLFATTKDIQTLKLRIFLTSRPEIPIRFGFREMNRILHKDLVLQNVSRALVERDIILFYQSEFDKMKTTRQLELDWPCQPQLEQLVKKTDCLFIFAATACRFIGGASHISPKQRLSELLLSKNSNRLSTRYLDAMYLKILQESIRGEYTDEEQRQVAEQFRVVVGSIIVLFDVLSISGLSSLICRDTSGGQDFVSDVLSSLHSVLVIPDNHIHPIRLLHPSFRDFLLDQQRCPDERFWIDHTALHHRLAEDCITTMSRDLHKNICKLASPGVLVAEIKKDLIESCVLPHLQYACLYWVEHMKNGDYNLRNSSRVYEFLRDHFLHWLEVLSLMNRISDGLSSIFQLQSMLPLRNAEDLRSLLGDAKQFLLSNRHVLETAPLQIYISAIVFSPQESTVKRLFLHEVPNWLTMLSLPDNNWGHCLSTLERHSSTVTSVVFSPDGLLLASGSWDNTVRLWEVKTGESRGTLEGHSGHITTMVFSPDGQLVASGSGDHTVRLWEVKTGEPRGILEGHLEQVITVVFSPDGQLLASGSWDHTVRLWEMKTGKPRGTLEGHSSKVSTVVFSPDGQLLASGSWDHTVQLWKVKTGEPCGTLKGHLKGVSTVVFSPDGQLLASGSEDRTVRLWEVKTGGSRSTLKGHSRSVSSVVFSPNGQLLASGSWDETVRLWEVRTGESRVTFEGHSGHVTTVVFSPDGQLLASGSWDHTMRLWEVKTGKPRGILDGHSSGVRTVVFSPDGQLLASGSEDRTVRLWEVKTDESRRTLEGHSSHITTMVFSPDGQLLASGSQDHNIRLWEVKTGEPRGTLEGHSRSVSSVVFSPNGLLLASGSWDETVRLWEVKTGRSCGTLNGHSSGVGTVIFSPDGLLLASGSWDETVRLWEVKTGEPRGTLQGHSSGVRTVVFSPDGQLLASGSEDRTVRLWEVKTGESESRYALQGHSSPVRAVVFSPDGQLLASESRDHTVRLWEVKIGTSIFCGDIPENTNFSFASKGQSLYIGSKQIDVSSSSPRDITETSSSIPLIGLNRREDWVMSGTCKLLWVPPDRRLGVSAIHANFVALGNGAGRVTFLKINSRADYAL